MLRTEICSDRQFGGVTGGGGWYGLMRGNRGGQARKVRMRDTEDGLRQ